MLQLPKFHLILWFVFPLPHLHVFFSQPKITLQLSSSNNLNISSNSLNISSSSLSISFKTLHPILILSLLIEAAPEGHQQATSRHRMFQLPKQGALDNHLPNGCM